MVPFLGSNLAETTPVWPLQSGGQTQQEPPLAKAPAVEAEREEKPAQGKRQEGQRAGNGDCGKRTQQKPHAAVSGSRRQWRQEALAPMAGRIYA